MSLALLYCLGLPKTLYKKNEKILDWATAGLHFWTRIQHSNGAFDEYYPSENGYIPTSFTLFSATETCTLLKVEDPVVLESCLKAARYLIRHSEVEALNQEASKVYSLFNVYLLTGEKWAAKAAEKNLNVSRKNKARTVFSPNMEEQT